MLRIVQLMSIALVMCCCGTAVDDASAATTAAPGERISLYSVPLMCPAAHGIGCGSRAKPLLLALEKTDMVSEAWLDRPGRTLAVVWAAQSDPATRPIVLKQLADDHDVDLQELAGAARDANMTSFRSGDGWHRGADVDRLSEEEAGVIADRLLARTIADAPTAKLKAGSLRPQLTQALERMLVGEMPPTAECHKILNELGSRYLDAGELAAFRSAYERGYRPVDGEH